MQFVPLWTSINKSRKIHALSGDDFKFWVMCLTLAQEHDSRTGTLPDLDSIGFALHLETDEVETRMSTLLECRLIDESDDVYIIHDWFDWKYRPDPTNAERQRRHKAKKRREREDKKVTPVTVTPLNSESNEITPYLTSPHLTSPNTKTPPNPLEGESVCVCDIPSRAPEDQSHFTEACKVLGGSLQTEGIALELSRNSDLTEVRSIDGWRWLYAARVMGAGSKGRSYGYLLGIARNAKREDWDSLNRKDAERNGQHKPPVKMLTDEQLEEAQKRMRTAIAQKEIRDARNKP